MRVGFTGTREGFTEPQLGAFRSWFTGKVAVEFHHGACVGADAGAVWAIHGTREVQLIAAHPGDIPALTDTDAMKASDTISGFRPCLARNRDIVDAADVLLACPKGPEERRSGTWSTIRYARRCRKPVVIFWPDGSITEEPARTLP